MTLSKCLNLILELHSMQSLMLNLLKKLKQRKLQLKKLKLLLREMTKMKTAREAAEVVEVEEEAEVKSKTGEELTVKKKEEDTEEEVIEEEVTEEEETGEVETMVLMPKVLRPSKLVVIEILEGEAEEEAEVIEAAGEALTVKKEEEDGEEPTVKKKEAVTDLELAEEEVKDLQEEVLVKKLTEIFQELLLQPQSQLRLRNE